MTNAGYDQALHQRDRIRRLEARCSGLERERDQLARLLASVLAALFDDTYTDPIEYLQALCDIDQAKLELGL